jgi:hypothetical protein
MRVEGAENGCVQLLFQMACTDVHLNLRSD